jgi:hypothetical protein
LYRAPSGKTLISEENICIRFNKNKCTGSFKESFAHYRESEMMAKLIYGNDKYSLRVAIG